MSDTLVAAKQEYTQQLSDLLSPSIYSGFKSIWKGCKTADKKILKCFQEKLSLVPLWNQSVIDNEFERICKKEDTKVFLDKLIEAVFLSNVKVLSSVRMGKSKALSIAVPDTKKFIHQCYVEGARKLWQDPHLIDDREEVLSYSELKRNEKRLLLTISDSIEKTISRMIPIQSILESYLNEMDSSDDEDIAPPLSDEESDKETEHENNKMSGGALEIEEDDDSEPEENKVFMEDPGLQIPEPVELEEFGTKEPNLFVTEGANIEEASENNDSVMSVKFPEHGSNTHTPVKEIEETQSDNQKNFFFSDSDESDGAVENYSTE
jgi:hypothetical protein